MTEAEAWNIALSHQKIVLRVLRGHFKNLGSADRPAVSAGDYEQAGMIGLYYAAQHFQESFGVPFDKYAFAWVRKYITDTLNAEGFKTVYIPPRSAYDAKKSQDQSIKLCRAIDRAKKEEIRLDASILTYSEPSRDQISDVINALDVQTMTRTLTIESKTILSTAFSKANPMSSVKVANIISELRELPV